MCCKIGSSCNSLHRMFQKTTQGNICSHIGYVDSRWITHYTSKLLCKLGGDQNFETQPLIYLNIAACSNWNLEWALILLLLNILKNLFYLGKAYFLAAGFDGLLLLYFKTAALSRFFVGEQPSLLLVWVRKNYPVFHVITLKLLFLWLAHERKNWDDQIMLMVWVPPLQ